MTKLPLAPHPIYYPFILCCFLLLTLHADCQLLQSQELTLLLKLKQQWQNPPLLDHWVSSTNLSSHCSWPEVYCTNGSVNELDLSNKEINGTIPPFICDLTNLSFLIFYWNNIGGEFPTGLYNCSKLSYLDISQNLFVGPLPSDIDRMPATLETLYIGGNNFSFDIPPSIGNLQNLKVLSFFQSQYNGSYPEEIANLKNLEVLEMAYNPKLVPSELTTLNFTSLKKLRHLSIAGSNLIGEIPATIGELENLEYLDLSMNNLTGRIPESVFAKKNLTEVYLSGNSLMGEIPEVTESWSLSVIDLSVNNLTGHVPDSFGKLESLSILRLMNNKLSGEIPASIGRLPALTVFRLFHNNFSGTLPPDFGRFSELESFEVFSNNFTGELPKDLCAAGKLLGVTAEDNALTGEVPESLARCDSLLIVKLTNNRFSGKFPEGIWKVTNISLLLLSGNQFEGQIPSDVSWNLSSVDISDNRFSGEIPVGISSWKNLVVFKASNNRLTGSVPEEITDLNLLTTLSLRENQLSGTIPEIISWRSLNTLDLSSNQLSGSIPDGFGSLPVLTQLDFSDNRLTGSIPIDLGRLNLNLLNLSSNSLVGRIPYELDISAYSDSFLNNPGLCTANPSQVKLGSCRAGTAAKTSSRTEIWIGIIAVGACLLAVVVVSLSVIRSYRRKRLELKTNWKMTPFHVLNFTESNIISGMTDSNLVGSGGSGKVYRVCVDKSGSYVAVKKIFNSRKLDYKLEKEFQAEVQILGKIRHLNIVKLLCCISSDTSKLLVYEYLENRSLDQWLYQKKRVAISSTPGSGGNGVMLDWPKRLKIAIGAAQGLCYMHHDCSPPIIHRDVKSSNVLLDSEFNAKIADFGLARILMKPGEANSMSVVAGTFGYIAPEYAQTTRVNEKIDVYSFGIILLELTTGREANDEDEDLCLAEWAWKHIQDGKQISNALDKDIKEESSYMEEMSSVFKLGIVCTATLPSARPSMKEVLQILLSCSHHISVHVADKSPVKEGDVAATPLLRNSKREQQNN